MRAFRRIVPAVALVIGLAACGAQAQDNAGSAGGSRALQAAAPTPEMVGFGGQYRFSDGITVSVTTPKSFQPSASAYPRSDRGVAFDIVIRNDGDQSYQLSGLSVTATVGGVTAKQLVDSTQGYSGIIDAGKDVPPQRDVRVTLAFAVPSQPSEMRLSLRPAPTTPVVAVYSGSA
ncbi:hypothetical protein HFP15_18185 [Amycolatopsis sp. K13G38]|uniref:DUF4352 domain-containing protein n=1 Tax=Amycolatopsis acididurans TaxID=2724524 RepID=A0ABX1J933_9PSEU|nr:hypothetical protein [Amycolatopsis acididurans]NKQ54817.1 hypothetical protein [Amycolatopsis acididurans]